MSSKRFLAFAVVLAGPLSLLRCAAIPSFSGAPSLDGAVSLDARTEGDDATSDAEATTEASTSDGGADANADVLRIFVTGSPQSGNFGQDFDGGVFTPSQVAQSADRLCSDAWLLAGHTKRNWRALVWAAKNLSPFANLNDPPAGWYRAPQRNQPNERVLVFGSRAQLLTGFPVNPIEYDEYGDPVDGSVWTGGTQSGGDNDNCSSWQDAVSSYGMTGLPTSTTSAWFGDAPRPCAAAYHLYCLELPP